jgi:hypothetical protein
MKGVLVTSVAAVALAASVSAGAASTGCSLAAAKAAIRSARPHVQSLANAPMLVTPAMADLVVCVDLSRDGRTDMGVTVASGGSAGDIAWLAFLRTATGWRVVHRQSGYKVGLFRVGHDLVDSQPVYRKNDANCCPSGGVDHERWHWNGRALVRIRAWHTRSYRP